MAYQLMNIFSGAPALTTLSLVVISSFCLVPKTLRNLRQKKEKLRMGFLEDLEVIRNRGDVFSDPEYLAHVLKIRRLVL